jgi:hypothetical protein
MRQVGGFLQVLKVSSTNKTDLHDLAKILLKVVLNTDLPLSNLHKFVINKNTTQKES